MDEELVMACAEFTVVGTPVNDGDKNDDIQTDIGEDIQATSGAPEVVGLKQEHSSYPIPIGTCI